MQQPPYDSFWTISVFSWVNNQLLSSSFQHFESKVRRSLLHKLFTLTIEICVSHDCSDEGIKHWGSKRTDHSRDKEFCTSGNCNSTSKILNNSKKELFETETKYFDHTLFLFVLFSRITEVALQGTRVCFDDSCIQDKRHNNKQEIRRNSCLRFCVTRSEVFLFFV